MHPDLLFILATDRVRRDHRDADLRRHAVRRTRPPRRWRFALAVVLGHVAARVTREPVVILPRRAEPVTAPSRCS